MELLKGFKYSLPLYPGLDSDDLNNRIIPFLKLAKNYIYDIYFTTRIDPFKQDAMGMVFDKQDEKLMMAQALYIQAETGILVSATFNNINISPSYSNYKIFIENFKPLYKLGITKITIPFKSWLLFGLKKEFPNLFVKNTILENIREPFQLANAYEAGFDYINIDRSLMRNQNRVKELNETKIYMEQKLNKKLYLSILINESCSGNCPLQSEHFLYNNTREIKDKSEVFFKSEFNNIACKSDIFNKFSNNYNPLKIANFIMDDFWLKDLIDIDVLKLHGRENKIVFENSLSLLNNLIDPNFKYIDNFKKIIKREDWNNFIEKTKNCNFDCFKCNYCDVLFNKIKI